MPLVKAANTLFAIQFAKDKGLVTVDENLHFTHINDAHLENEEVFVNVTDNKMSVYNKFAHNQPIEILQVEINNNDGSGKFTQHLKFANNTGLVITQINERISIASYTKYFNENTIIIIGSTTEEDNREDEIHQEVELEEETNVTSSDELQENPNNKNDSTTTSNIFESMNRWEEQSTNQMKALSSSNQESTSFNSREINKSYEKHPAKIKNCILLGRKPVFWQLLVEMLCSPYCKSIVQWINTKENIFKIRDMPTMLKYWQVQKTNIKAIREDSLERTLRSHRDKTSFPRIKVIREYKKGKSTLYQFLTPWKEIIDKSMKYPFEYKWPPEHMDNILLSQNKQH